MILPGLKCTFGTITSTRINMEVDHTAKYISICFQGSVHQHRINLVFITIRNKSLNCVCLTSKLLGSVDTYHWNTHPHSVDKVLSIKVSVLIDWRHTFGGISKNTICSKLENNILVCNDAEDSSSFSIHPLPT